MEANENNGVLINVREQAEIQAKSVPASISIPRGIQDMKITGFVSAAEHPIYPHCASASRPTLSAENGRIVPVEEKSEVCTRGDSVMLVYWNDEEKTCEIIDNDMVFCRGENRANR